MPSWLKPKKQKNKPADDLNWRFLASKKGAAKQKTIEHVEQSNKQGMASLRAQLAKAKEAKNKPTDDLNWRLLAIKKVRKA